MYSKNRIGNRNTLVAESKHLLSNSNSSRTGTIGLRGHNPNRRATRTIAPTIANKVQMPNSSFVDM